MDTDLGRGETEVLALALERDDVVAVLDDRRARRVVWRCAEDVEADAVGANEFAGPEGVGHEEAMGRSEKRG